MRTLVLTSLLLTACGLQPCLDQCEADGEFFTTCMDDQGRLCDGLVSVDCVDDYEAYLAALALEAQCPECEYLLPVETGAAHYCTSSSDVVSSCKYVHRQEAADLDAAGRDALAEECEAEPATDFAQAMADQDCEAFCALLGM